MNRPAPRPRDGGHKSLPKPKAIPDVVPGGSHTANIFSPPYPDAGRWLSNPITIAPKTRGAVTKVRRWRALKGITQMGFLNEEASPAS